MFNIRFACEHCGEILAENVNEDNVIESDEFHDCFGETVGYMGEIHSDRIILFEGIEIRVE